LNLLPKDLLSVLDLGSGNGRFYLFLEKNLHKDFNYLGLDQSDSLMDIAIGKYGTKDNFKQKKFDVISEIEKVKSSYDVVIAFGLTHHIPSQVLRKKWFEAVGKLINKDGLLIMTFWNLSKEGKKSQEWLKDGLRKMLEKGDSFKGWKDIKSELRYVHIYSEEEISKVIKIQKKNKLRLIDRFYSDESKNSLNLYLIFKKD